jgi:hypothetical protein
MFLILVIIIHYGSMTVNPITAAEPDLQFASPISTTLFFYVDVTHIPQPKTDEILSQLQQIAAYYHHLTRKTGPKCNAKQRVCLNDVNRPIHQSMGRRRMRLGQIPLFGAAEIG